MADFNIHGIFKDIGKWQKSVKSSFVLVVYSSVLVIGMVSCANSEGEKIDIEEGPPQRRGGSTDPSWAFIYNSIDDMCSHSDVIVVGTVDSISEIEDDHPMYTTYWNLKIESVLKGDDMEEITVGQMGSPDVPYSDISSCPLFHTGDRYLLFLSTSETGRYYFHPQGHFMIWKDRVYSMNYILPEGKALRLVPGLNCNGVELKTIEEKITGVVNSVHLMFTRYPWRGPFDVIRQDAGMTGEIYVSLFSGNNGPGKVIYKINKETLDENITVSIRPEQFTVGPYDEYESRILITTDYNIAPGTYLIPVEYDFEGVDSGSRTITLHINAIDKNTVTERELRERGLLPPEEN